MMWDLIRKKEKGRLVTLDCFYQSWRFWLQNRQLTQAVAREDQALPFELSTPLERGHPTENRHRDIVWPTHISIHLLLQIFERVEAQEVVEPLLIVPMASLNFAIMPGSSRPNQFVGYPDFFAEDVEGMRSIIFFAIGELGAIVWVIPNSG